MVDAAWMPPWPDASRLVTEDDTPVDNLPSERNQRLLVSALYAGWPGPPPFPESPQEPRPFLAAANVGLFATPEQPPIVPDVLLSTDVLVDALAWTPGGRRAYLMWDFGKPPELVIELVSNREGGELGKKVRAYGRLHVSTYVVFDPGQMLGQQELQAFQLHGDILRPVPLGGDGTAWIEALGLGLRPWDGVFDRTLGRWLRFVDARGRLIPTGEERAEAERVRADEASARADEASARAERMAQQLRALGIEPE